MMEIKCMCQNVVANESQAISFFKQLLAASNDSGDEEFIDIGCTDCGQANIVVMKVQLRKGALKEIQEWDDKFRDCVRSVIKGILTDEELKAVLGVGVLPMTPEVKDILKQNRILRKNAQELLKKLDKEAEIE